MLVYRKERCEYAESLLKNKDLIKGLDEYGDDVLNMIRDNIPDLVNFYGDLVNLFVI